MSPTALVANSIYTVLFSRKTENTWHWTLCIPKDIDTALKLHVTQPVGDPSQWFFENPAKEISLATSLTACVVIHIGALKSMNDYGPVVQLLQTIPMTIPQEDVGIEPKFTCRVWWKQAIRLLSDRGYIKCDNVQALENECIEYAKTNPPLQGGSPHYEYHTSRSSRSTNTT